MSFVSFLQFGIKLSCADWSCMFKKYFPANNATTKRALPTGVTVSPLSHTNFLDKLVDQKVVDNSVKNYEGTPLADIYIPNLRKYEENFFSHGAEHLDIVTAWRGISVKQGHELVFWRSAFEKALDDQLGFCRFQGQNFFSPKTVQCKFKT